MLAYRVIARLDIKAPNLIKGIQFEGLRVLGKPKDFASRYTDADELLYIDTVASLYGRNQLEGLIGETSESVFLPLTVEGGIATAQDAKRLFSAGADKIALNTAALENPQTITALAGKFGSQAVTVSIQAKRSNASWEAFAQGRIPSGRDALRWAEEAEDLGAGEVLITSVDQDGTRKGPDWDLLKAISKLNLDIPIVYGGGIRLEDVQRVSEFTDGMAIGAALHYSDFTISQVKTALKPYAEVR